MGNLIDGLLGLVGNVGNAMGVVGDNPQGANALQRIAQTPETQAMGQQNIQNNLAALQTNPNFQQAPADQKQAMIAHVTGADADAQQQTKLSALGNLNFQNDPKGSVAKGMQTGVVPVDAGLNYLANPAVGAGSIMTMPNAQPQSNQPAQPQAAGTPTQKPGINYPLYQQAMQQSPLIATKAMNFINGLSGMESGKGANDPTDIAAMNLASKIDPSFNTQSLIGRPAMAKNYSANQDGWKLETSLNTGMAHLYDLHQLADKTGNTADSRPAMNTAGNWISSRFGAGGNPGLERYRSSLKTAAPEIAKYLGGGNATDTGTEEAESSYDSSLPAATIQKNATDLGAKMMAKGGSLQDEYNTTMGNAAAHDIVHPLTSALYKDMQGVPLTLQEQQLVNAHRKESNLEPKTWGRAQTVSQPVPVNVPKGQTAAPSANNAPMQISPADARAELIRRGKIKQ